jgi:hypothetical protein
MNAIKLINNTGTDIRGFEEEILAAIDNGGTLPEELADVFTLRRSSAANEDGSPRWILSFA